MLYRYLSYFTIISLAISLLSCSGISSVDSERDSAPTDYVNVDEIPDAVPQPVQRTKYGNPPSYVVFGKRYHVMSKGEGYKERGIASWYGKKFHGRRTSSGEPYDMHAMTAAHKTLPLPTYVRVTNLKNKRQVILKVNDRGPFHDNRIIDLSHTAAVKLGIKATGTGWVEVEAIHVASNAKSSPSQAIAPATNKVIEKTQHSALPPTLQDKAKLYLQVGAFSKTNNAQKLKDNLSSQLNTINKPYKVMIFDAKKSAQTIFRVRIGPIESIEIAEKISASIVQYGFKKPLIVIE
jgi:rare lipoprotein A